MKNLSLILNVALFVLVGILFYFQFSNKNSTPASGITHSKESQTQTARGQVIAYFDIDSFQNNYSFYKEKKAEIENKQQAIEHEMARDEKKIQTMIEGYQKKAETMTEEEYYIAQQKLAMEQQNAQQKAQNSTDALLKQTEKFNQELMESITSYLKEYNADGRYTYILPYTKSAPNILYVDERYDITKDIIEGMNAKLKSKK